MKKTAYLILVAIVSAAMISCEHKNLCYSDTMDVEVVFNWEMAPDADPKSMSLYLFPENGGSALRFEFSDNRGGLIRAPAGRYDALCLNSDTEAIEYRNREQQRTFEVTTRSTSLLSDPALVGLNSTSIPRSAGTESERIALAPDMLWCDHLEQIILRQSQDRQVITFYPDQAVCTYTVEIRNAKNLEHVLGLNGSLASMAGGVYVARAETTDEPVTIPFELSASTDKVTLTGRLLTFGTRPSRQPHKMIVYAMLSDRSKWYYTYDVTDQIRMAPDPRNVHIIVDSLPLPKPITNGGGFHPSVDDWDNINVNIDM